VGGRERRREFFPVFFLEMIVREREVGRVLGID
jgi:hypothetical protein